MLNNCFTMGRASGNDLYVSELHVSRFHARFLREPDGLYIENLSNTNQTTVNGVVVNRCRVSPGDRISLSDHYQLDWNDPSLRAWIAGGQAGFQQSSLPYNKPQGFQPSGGGIAQHLSIASVTPPSLWLVLGIFFFVSYFVPVWEDLFFWSVFEGSAFGGITFLYIALAGLAMITIAYTVKGKGRAVSLASIGFTGLVMFMFLMLQSSGIVDSDMLAGGLFGIIAFVVLLGMLVLNDVTCSNPDHGSVRLMGGIFASVYAAIATFVQVMVIIELADIRLNESMVAFSLIFTTISYLTLLTSAILIIANIQKKFYTQRNARIAERLGLWTILAQVILSSFIIALGSHNGGWVFFLNLRMFVFMMGLALLLGGGVSDLIKDGIVSSRRRSF